MKIFPRNNEDEFIKRRRSFWDDQEIGPLLDAIPEREMSMIVRNAVRHWYGLPTACMPAKPLSLVNSDTAQRVARELMKNIKAGDRSGYPQNS